MKAYVFILVAYGLFLLVEIIALVRVLVQYLPPVRRVKITFRINIVIFFTGLSMLAVVILFDINYFLYKSPMSYSEWQNITFEDFRGFKRPGETLDGQKDFAFIVTSTEVRREGNTVDVVTYFHPARSYAYNSDLENDRLLKHEVYHFHISEYCARLLRQQLSNSTEILTENKLDQLAEQTERFEDSLQFQYDDQSYHSYIAGKQLMWEKKVDSCLNATKDYTNTLIKLRSLGK